jgi:hypothetical protein
LIHLFIRLANLSFRTLINPKNLIFSSNHLSFTENNKHRRTHKSNWLRFSLGQQTMKKHWKVSRESIAPQS